MDDPEEASCVGHYTLTFMSIRLVEYPSLASAPGRTAATGRAGGRARGAGVRLRAKLSAGCDVARMGSSAWLSRMTPIREVAASATRPRR